MFKWLFGKREDGEAASGGTPEIIVITRKVKKPRDEVFTAFVDRFGTWWPRERPLTGGAVGTTAIEPRIGGKATETSVGGATHTWGTVLSFQRPEHIVVAWQIAPTGGLEASEATSSRVDVRFVAIDADNTEVVVVHRDFPRHGEGWQAYRASMGGKTGWPQIMEAFARSVGG